MELQGKPAEEEKVSTSELYAILNLPIDVSRNAH